MASVMDFLNKCPELPPAPTAALRVVSLIHSGDYDIRQLEQVIRVDEALSFAVLKLGNSAAYGAPGRSFNLTQCIARLGAKTLSKFILEQSTRQVYHGAGRAYGLRREDLWRGAVGGAIAAELIAKRHEYADPALAFTCGLLRDVGKLVIEIMYGDDTPRLLEQASHLECHLERERAVFGVDHAVLGAALAERWGLPAPIPDAIRFHHEPPTPDHPSHDDLFDVVHAADLISLWAGLAIGVDGLEYRLAPHVKERLHLGIREAEFEIAETWARVSEIESMLEQTTTG